MNSTPKWELKTEKNICEIFNKCKEIDICFQILTKEFSLYINSVLLEHRVQSLLKSDLSTNNNLDSALHLCNLHNKTLKRNLGKEKCAIKSNICSNTYPSLFSQNKIIDVGNILHAISKNRSELCCNLLLVPILKAFKLDDILDDESETSSIEILRALTIDGTHFKDNNSQELQLENQYQSDTENESTKFVCNEKFGKDNLLESLIKEEEDFILKIVFKCAQHFPSLFDSQINTQSIDKWVNHGIKNVWIQIGTTLEHVILWWGFYACRSIVFTKRLREWLLKLKSNDAPEPILSILRGLGESLTTYVAYCVWDQEFRVAMVASYSNSNVEISITQKSSFSMQIAGTKTGNIWYQVLKTLKNTCNTCDENGTIPNQLPIVEQIPILHRLDHTVHSVRLWITFKSKSLCSEWNMLTFFKIIDDDLENFMKCLHNLRVPDLVIPDEVLLQVCVALRSKLISEIKTNISKLKDTHKECINVLATECRILSSATLSLCFPKSKIWQNETYNEISNDYVNYFFTEVYLPIAKATKNIEILSLSLKIMCEAWLDHIYLKKIKFSTVGAYNLLTDFEGAAKWILDCPVLEFEYRQKLSRHEVLKMCEGVGKILLRKPDEIVRILESKPSYKQETNEANLELGKLPPEMFVPNQKRWLELRARKKSSLYFCICK